MSTWQQLQQDARSVWRQRPPRERALLALGAAVLLAAGGWTALVAPAWRVWREAPAQQARIEQQTRHMLQLQAQARLLQAPRRIERAEALSLLQTSAATWLGPGVQLVPQGDELRVTLKAAPAQGLAEWLVQAREKALARPHMAQLQQQAATEPAAGTTWSGTLVLRLP